MRVAMPLPDLDFDPTEAATTWSLIGDAGHEVRFATEQGAQPKADPLMVTGEGLDPWGFIPGLKRLKVVGLALRAQQTARAEAEGEPEGHRSVESEVKRALANEGDIGTSPRTVRDGSYVSARWPGDTWIPSRNSSSKPWSAQTR